MSEPKERQRETADAGLQEGDRLRRLAKAERRMEGTMMELGRVREMAAHNLRQAQAAWEAADRLQAEVIAFVMCLREAGVPEAVIVQAGETAAARCHASVPEGGGGRHER